VWCEGGLDARFIKKLSYVSLKKEHIRKFFKGEITLKNLDQYPKSIKKAIRYIKQEAKKEELKEIQRLIERAIELRSLRAE
jgi:2'-5' RNA ligase